MREHRTVAELTLEELDCLIGQHKNRSDEPHLWDIKYHEERMEYFIKIRDGAFAKEEEGAE
jgi:hypothetical protein